jgi:hypothetical protein
MVMKNGNNYKYNNNCDMKNRVHADTSPMLLRSGRRVLRAPRDTFKMCRRSARQWLRSAGEPDPELDSFLAYLETLKQPTTIACQRAPASNPESGPGDVRPTRRHSLACLRPLLTRQRRVPAARWAVACCHGLKG